MIKTAKHAKTLSSQRTSLTLKQNSDLKDFID